MTVFTEDVRKLSIAQLVRFFFFFLFRHSLVGVLMMEAGILDQCSSCP